MSWLRGLLVGLSLVATAASAEEIAAHVRAGVWRTIEVPLVEAKTEPGPVPELHVAPGSATLLKMPDAIVGPDGFAVVGGEGRVEAKRMNSTTLVLAASREIGPERIPLAVATIDGRRYPFLLVTRPSVVDLEVRVVLYDNTRLVVDCQENRSEVVDALLHHEPVYSRQYEQPEPKESGSVTQGSPMGRGTPFVRSVIRIGKRYVIQISSLAPEPWKVEQAKLVGQGGEVLKVQAVHWQMTPENDNVNVIEADVPEGAGTDYALESIELVGQDWRVASLDQKVSLP